MSEKQPVSDDYELATGAERLPTELTVPTNVVSDTHREAAPQRGRRETLRCHLGSLLRFAPAYEGIEIYRNVIETKQTSAE